MIAMTPILPLTAQADARRAAVVSSVAALGDEVLLVHAQRPNDCQPRAAMIIFPGVERNAYDYLDHASRLATSQCLSVYAPELDRRRFPRWRYQRGGVLRHGRLADPANCTGKVISRLISWVRRQEGREDLPVILFGHSAGGQLLSRVTAYCPSTGASQPARIVVANPSGYVGADFEAAVPYGYSVPGRPQELLPDARERLRAYLAQPVTIYLGGRDTGSRHLNQEAGARKQGDNRLARGMHVFNEAQGVAASQGWAFNWRLVVADGVGHSAKRMLTNPVAMQAIQPSRH